MLSERPIVPPMQVTFSHNPGLMGQQVGGVTYYSNLPPSAPISGVPTLMQGNTPIGSPLRTLSSAIPIRPPMEWRHSLPGEIPAITPSVRGVGEIPVDPKIATSTHSEEKTAWTCV